MQQVVNKEYKPLFTEKPRYFILMGGRGGGRSTVASQFVNAKLVAPEYFRCAIMRYVLGDIRNSIYREIIDRAEENGIINSLDINDSIMSIKYGANSVNAVGFRKSSSDQKAKLKSLANYNFVVIEEADEIPEADFMQLDDSLRTVKGDISLILLLNPPPKNHWIIQRFFDLTPHPEVKDFYIPTLRKDIDNTIFISTNYRDNEVNMSADSMANYKRYKQTKPEYYWNTVEGLVPETIRGKIYKNWELIDKLPEGATLLRIGGDWGWYPDPAATIALYYYDGYYIVDGISYGTEIEDDVLAADIKNVPGGDTVRAAFGADEPKSITLMENKGIKAVKAISGPGSVDTRIKLTSEKRIKVVRKNHPIYGNWVWNAYEVYHWAEDKDGNPKGEPDHRGSDPMDAVSYAIADLAEKKGGGVHIHRPKSSGYRAQAPLNEIKEATKSRGSHIFRPNRANRFGKLG